MSAIECFFSAQGKFYRTSKGLVVPSAGSICTALTKENFDYVGIASLEKAILMGTGAHDVCCQYSLHLLKHLDSVVLPPMPAGFPGTIEEWDAAMGHALLQVIDLFETYSVEPVGVEEVAVCSTYGFGGQPDLKCWMRYKGKRLLAVWDFKRVYALSLSHYLKLECYRMLDSFQDCKVSFIAWLNKTDRAKLIYCPNNAEYRAAICGTAGMLNFQISKRVLVP